MIVQNATKSTGRRPGGATDGRGRLRPVGDGRRRAETLRKPNATRQSRRGRPGEKPDETLSCTLFSVSRFPPLLSSPSVPSLGKPSSQPTQHRADLGSCSCHPLLAIAPLHHRTSSKAPFTSPRVASAPSTARQETSFPSSRPSSNPSLVFLSRPLWSPLLLGPWCSRSRSRPRRFTSSRPSHPSGPRVQHPRRARRSPPPLASLPPCPRQRRRVRRHRRRLASQPPSSRSTAQSRPGKSRPSPPLLPWSLAISRSRGSSSIMDKLRPR